MAECSSSSVTSDRLSRSSSGDSDDEDDWTEEGEGEEAMCECPPCLCLFCSDEFSEGVTAMLEHCALVHEFRLVRFMSALGQ